MDPLTLKKIRRRQFYTFNILFAFIIGILLIGRWLGSIQIPFLFAGVLIILYGLLKRKYPSNHQELLKELEIYEREKLGSNYNKLATKNKQPETIGIGLIIIGVFNPLRLRGLILLPVKGIILIFLIVMPVLTLSQLLIHKKIDSSSQKELENLHRWYIFIGIIDGLIISLGAIVLAFFVD